MRLGRNLGRTFLEYYRFINVLPICPTRELTTKRSGGRPKTHRPRARSKARSETHHSSTRPKTTRACAPISYKDLAKCYESDSNEGSPVRYNYMSYGFGTRATGNIYMVNQDQYSLCNIQASKFSALDFSGEFKGTAPTTKATVNVKASGYKSDGEQQNHVKIAPKPYLTIIDFNQLTRGGLERAKGKSFDSAEKCLKQSSSSPKKSNKGV